MQYPHQLTFDPDKQTALFCKEENIESERRFIYYTEKVYRVQKFFHRYFSSSEPNELAATSIYVNNMNRDSQIEVK